MGQKSPLSSTIEIHDLSSRLRLKPVHYQTRTPCLKWRSDLLEEGACSFTALNISSLLPSLPWRTRDVQLTLQMKGHAQTSQELLNTGPRFILISMELKHHYGPVVSRVPLAAIINCYKPGGLSQHKCVILQFWRPGVWKRSYWAKVEVPIRGAFLLEAPGENSFPGFFQLLESAFLGSWRDIRVRKAKWNCPGTVPPPHPHGKIKSNTTCLGEYRD